MCHSNESELVATIKLLSNEHTVTDIMYVILLNAIIFAIHGPMNVII